MPNNRIPTHPTLSPSPLPSSQLPSILSFHPFLYRLNFSRPGAGSVPPACAACRSCAAARAGQTPRAWRGSRWREGRCRSSGGWLAARPAPRRRARSRRPSPPHTAPAPGWPGRALWTGAWRGPVRGTSSKQGQSELIEFIIHTFVCLYLLCSVLYGDMWSSWTNTPTGSLLSCDRRTKPRQKDKIALKKSPGSEWEERTKRLKKIKRTGSETDRKVPWYFARMEGIRLLLKLHNRTSLAPEWDPLWK